VRVNYDSRAALEMNVEECVKGNHSRESLFLARARLFQEALHSIALKGNISADVRTARPFA
jgi:hypothetical protein